MDERVADGDAELAGEELDLVLGLGVVEVHRQRDGSGVFLYDSDEFLPEIVAQHRGADVYGKPFDAGAGNVAEQ